MTIAEIRGKISSDSSKVYERLEDLLTSDVFGTFKYLEPTYIYTFLKNHLKRFSEEQPDFRINCDNIQKVEYIFWPKIGTKEPDLILQFKYGNQILFSVIIEAKYMSGASDFELNDSELQKEKRQHETVLTGNQLADYFLELKDYGEDKYLVYCTSHFIPPREEYENAVCAVKSKGEDLVEYFLQRFYWTSWREVYKFFRGNRGKGTLLIDDLLLLLERKNFNPISWNSVINKKFTTSDIKFYEGAEYFNFDSPIFKPTDLSFWECLDEQ